MTDVAHDSGPVRARSMPSLAWHIVLCAVSIGMLYPLIWMLASSFKPEDEIFSSASLWPSHFSLKAYSRGWSGLQVSFGRFFVNSAIVAISAVIGNVLTCSLAAYAFARLKFAGRDFWFAVMLGTMMLPYHVTLIPQYVLFLNLDWVNTFLPLVVPKFLAADAFFIFLLTQFFRMGYAAALAWILVVIIAAFTAFSFLTSRYWVHYDD